MACCVFWFQNKIGKINWAIGWFESSTVLCQKKILLWFCIYLVPLCVMFDCSKG